MVAARQLGCFNDYPIQKCSLSKNLLVCSLRLAADTLTIFVTLLIIIVAVSATLSMRVLMFLFELGKSHGLGSAVNLSLLGLALRLFRQHLLDLLALHRVDVSGEDKLEFDEQVAEFVRRLVERHTEVLARHHAVGLDNFARLVLDAHLATVEMSEHEVDASKGLEQRDLLLYEQIGTLTLESLMGLDANDDDYVTGFDIGHLITLTVNSKLGAIRRALIHLNLELLQGLLHLFTLAFLTALGHIKRLTLAAALVARTAGLRVHAGAHLTQDSADTLTLASTALLNC